MIFARTVQSPNSTLRQPRLGLYNSNHSNSSAKVLQRTRKINVAIASAMRYQPNTVKVCVWM